MRVPVLPRALAVALGGLLTVTGCTAVTDPGGSDPDTVVPSFDSSVSDGGSPSAAATGSAGTGKPGGKGGSTGAGPTGGNSGGTGNSGGKPTPKSSTGAPTIVYFRVADQPTCPAGTNVNPIPGSPVLLEWKVTNADRVALSVDGPGIYGDDYPTAGSEVFNFPCSGAEGDIQRHTYQLTVTNSAGKTTKTIVVSATVHEISSV